MDAYIFQATLLCPACATARMASDQASEGALTPDEDSDRYPQGPYAGGGGEADCPQHCDDCRVFLGNPLTGDGYTYVAASEPGPVADMWRAYYDIPRDPAEVG